MLETLRAKPNHIKQTISIVVTLIVFSGILFVWMSSRDARSREVEVRGKTVSPIDGVTSMFTGLVSDFKAKMSGAPSIEKIGDQIDTPTASTSFDLSGVVIIDRAVSSTTAN